MNKEQEVQKNKRRENQIQDDNNCSIDNGVANHHLPVMV
jgi:hypothetical protein